MPFDLDNYMRIAMGRESSGNPNARNPKSSASGQFQFIDPTYMAYARKMNPGVSEGALMAKKNDPQMQNAVMRAFTQDNVNTLQNAGIDPNNGSAYAAHFLGPQGALRALKADPNTPIDQVVDPQALASNPEVFSKIKTAGDFANWTNSYGGDAPQQPAQADLPAPGASEAQFQAPQAPDKSVWERVAAGDTSALYGPDMGDTLSNVGIALMSRDNPKGAEAMAAALRYSKDGKTKKTAGPKQVIKTDPKTGQVTVYDQDSGTFKTQQVFDRAPEEPKDPTRKQFQANKESADVAYEAAQKFGKWREAIAKGDVDVSILSQAEKSFDELLDKPMTPQQRNAVTMALDINKMGLAEQIKQKGTQTEGDWKRIQDSLQPKSGRFNNEAMLEAFDLGYKDMVKTYDRHIKYNEPVARKYGERIAYDGYDQEYKDRRKGIDDSEAAFPAVRDSFYKSRQDSAATAAQGITGGTQRTNPANGAPSFRENQTATGPNGQKMIFRGGKWEPL